MFKKVILLSGMLLAMLLVVRIAWATVPYVSSGLTTITYIESYTAYGAGDVRFKVASPHSQCSGGYWITSTDIGFAANVSMSISAKNRNSTVAAYGLPDQIWTGSATPHCKLYSLEIR